MSSIKGNWALVTGASSGLGTDFAKILAERGCNLVLTARREELLRKHKEEISEKYKVQVEIIPIDLSEKEAPKVLYDSIKNKGINIDILINNAGFGIFGKFHEIPWEKEKEMLELDIINLVHMTKLFLKDMVQKNYGYILQVSSVGAYQPTPTYATYSAAKSFVLNFGEAINFELKDTKVKVSVLSPGITETEFLKVSGQQKTFYQKLLLMQSYEVSLIGIEAMLKGKPSIIPGFMNKLSAFSLRFLPRKLITATAGLLMKN